MSGFDGLKSASSAALCESAETLLRRRVAEIDQELARLIALRADLASMLAAIPGPADSQGQCGHLRAHGSELADQVPVLI